MLYGPEKFLELSKNGPQVSGLSSNFHTQLKLLKLPYAAEIFRKFKLYYNYPCFIVKEYSG